MTRLRRGLTRTRESLRDQLGKAFERGRIDDALWEEIEEVLIGADAGVEATTSIVGSLKSETARRRLTDPESLWELLEDEIASRVAAAPDFLPDGRVGVCLVVGVNGSGKTTTIAKLTAWATAHARSVILAAADTYRAAAIDQLEIWADRLGVNIIKLPRGHDPSAVLYDAVRAAKARGMDLVIADTAGRLHTYEHLMQELAKMRRVADREVSASGEVKVLLVIDATTGQNGILQARAFDESVGVDAIALTKLDGTAKGGVILAIQGLLALPVAYIGTGERLADLEAFDPALFAKALVGR